MHTIRRTAAWVLSAERAPEAPHAVCGAACMACPAESAWVDNDSTPVELWAINHTAQRGLSHSQFSVTTQSHWTVDPRIGLPAPPSKPVPATEPDAAAGTALPGPGVNRPQSTGVHARPRGRWHPGTLLHRAVVRTGRFGAPLAVAGLVLASAALLAALLNAASGAGGG
ncbi:DUF7848 domain-containing protein [Streptomyces sp. 6N223]|uniref:DUF7848 domain-containing protein n=1 Tax=Streptomyces sp. 6N223 TaxID=3457412 RepID=UPI003FD410E4